MINIASFQLCYVKKAWFLLASLVGIIAYSSCDNPHQSDYFINETRHAIRVSDGIVDVDNTLFWQLVDVEGQMHLLYYDYKRHSISLLDMQSGEISLDCNLESEGPNKLDVAQISMSGDIIYIRSSFMSGYSSLTASCTLDKGALTSHSFWSEMDLEKPSATSYFFEISDLKELSTEAYPLWSAGHPIKYFFHTLYDV